jgi:hypothetical protein
MQLKKLKTLHLRQNFQEPFEEPDDNVDVPAIIHRFAASFYKHLDKISLAQISRISLLEGKTKET